MATRTLDKLNFKTERARRAKWLDHIRRLISREIDGSIKAYNCSRQLGILIVTLTHLQVAILTGSGWTQDMENEVWQGFSTIDIASAENGLVAQKYVDRMHSVRRLVDKIDIRVPTVNIANLKSCVQQSFIN
jgi:uncharacterized membrane protein